MIKIYRSCVIKNDAIPNKNMLFLSNKNTSPNNENTSAKRYKLFFFLTEK
jgi:hypothetical protein